ncbi:MAG: hypothetical protein PHG91_01835 [Syntrophales bacterium]|nr:hypothetical protein [Syntrophales bacterium]MDD5533365.1 hypothetical protein [Syntrophales bacterium]
MTALSAVLISAIVLFGMILFIPFRVTAGGRFERGFSGSILVAWAWDFLRLEYGAGGGTSFFLGRKRLFLVVRNGGRKREKKPKKKTQAKKGKRGGGPDLIAALIFNSPGVLSAARRICRSISPEGMITVAVGLGDPADTGLLLGMLAAVISWLPLPVVVLPEFAEEKFALEGRFSLRIFLAGIILQAAAFAASRSGREIISALSRRKKKWNT